MKIPRSPRCCNADKPENATDREMGRSGEDDAKPEDQSVSQYQQLRWEVGCPEASGRVLARLYTPTTLKGSGYGGII
ncbi:TPA: hypothetical protein JLR12_000630 [Escherichia coli]|nr:hypothetical protein [Escherichia coli]